jgi:hypothetical protein
MREVRLLPKLLSANIGSMHEVKLSPNRPDLCLFSECYFCPCMMNEVLSLIFRSFVWMSHDDWTGLCQTTTCSCKIMRERFMGMACWLGLCQTLIRELYDSPLMKSFYGTLTRLFYQSILISVQIHVIVGVRRGGAMNSSYLSLFAFQGV